MNDAYRRSRERLAEWLDRADSLLGDTPSKWERETVESHSVSHSKRYPHKS